MKKQPTKPERKKTYEYYDYCRCCPSYEGDFCSDIKKELRWITNCIFWLTPPKKNKTLGEKYNEKNQKEAS